MDTDDLSGCGSDYKHYSKYDILFWISSGVFGAALGTSLATGLITIGLITGVIVGSVPGFGAFSVQIDYTRPYSDIGIAKQVIEVLAPLVICRSAGCIAQFPFLMIISHFGPVIVAACEISRRSRGMMKTPIGDITGC